MGTLSRDTDPKMENLQFQLLRTVSHERKMEMLAQLNTAARLLAMTGLRDRFPNETESQLKYRLAVLLYGEEMAYKVYGETRHDE